MQRSWGGRQANLLQLAFLSRLYVFPADLYGFGPTGSPLKGLLGREIGKSTKPNNLKQIESCIIRLLGGSGGVQNSPTRVGTIYIHY